MSPDVALSFWLGGGGVALVVGLALARHRRLSSVRVTLGLLLLGGLVFVGARAHALLLEEGSSVGALLLEPRVWLGWGLRLPGGLLVATAFTPLVALALGLPYGRFSDVAVASGAALLAIGRIGCHLVGCCFGVPATVPWAVAYGAETAVHAAQVRRGLVASAAPLALPTHPIALYLAVAAGIVLLHLLWLERREARVGSMTFAGLSLLGLAFGAIEGLRDTVGNPPALYRQEMWLCMGGLVAAVWLVVCAWQRHQSPLAGTFAARRRGASGDTGIA